MTGTWNQMSPEEKYLDDVKVTFPIAIDNLVYFVQQLDGIYKTGAKLDSNLILEIADKIIANAEHIKWSKTEYDKIMQKELK